MLTPADDRLVGIGSARELVDGLAHAREIVLPETGHMFRFTHPSVYGDAIAAFVDAEFATDGVPREARPAA